jgi:hypothetical protein
VVKHQGDWNIVLENNREKSVTTPREMISLLQNALASNIGVKQIDVDGQKIVFNDRAAMIAELKFWQVEQAKFTGKRKPFRGINMGTSF